MDLSPSSLPVGLLQSLAWEWINIALECTASAWVSLPRFPLAVAAVNLATHPLLMLLLARHPLAPLPLAAAELAIALLEGLLLCLFYRRRARPLFLFAVALLMNAVSFGTGLLLALEPK